MPSTNNYSALVYILIAVMSMFFGYIVGTDKKEDYLSKKQQMEQTELKQKNSSNEKIDNTAK